MRHYVMTAAYRGPDYPLEANRRRIALCRAVTARSLAAQPPGWTWIVYVNPADPCLEERLDAFRSAGAPVIAIEGDATPVIDWSGPVLTTRIDDDDGFAGDAFRRLYRSIRETPPTRRLGLMFPIGYRINEGRAELVRHQRNAWSSIYAPKGDRVHIRMVQHQRIRRFVSVRTIDWDPAWLWVRHRDAQTEFRHAKDALTPAIRSLYPVDWAALEPERIAA